MDTRRIKATAGPCIWCREHVEDYSDEAGVPQSNQDLGDVAWATIDGDHGCDQSPEAIAAQGDEPGSCGAHARPSDAARWLLGLNELANLRPALVTDYHKTSASIVRKALACASIGGAA